MFENWPKFFKVNKYCQNRKQYLHEVPEWKKTVDNSSNNDNFYIVAGDAKALFYHLKSIGIVTGDNHSVSPANITLHYVISSVPEIINQAVLFKG